MMVLVLLKWVAPNPPTKPALKPKFNWVVVLALPELFGGSSKEGIVTGTPEGLAEFGKWSNSTMEYYYSGPPRAIHLS
jgi:hypothetical protein